MDRPADLIVLDVTGKDELCFHSVGQNQILRRVIRERDELDAFGHSAHDGHAGRSRRWTDSQRTGTRLTLERADQPHRRPSHCDSRRPGSHRVW